MSKYSNITFKGFRRENGRVGVRNHIIILPVDDISNAACEAVASVDGGGVDQLMKAALANTSERTPASP